jgi:hypothetical protein
MRRTDVLRQQDNSMPRPLRILTKLGLFDDIDHRAPTPPLRNSRERHHRVRHAA